MYLRRYLLIYTNVCLHEELPLKSVRSEQSDGLTYVSDNAVQMDDKVVTCVPI